MSREHLMTTTRVNHGALKAFMDSKVHPCCQPRSDEAKPRSTTMPLIEVHLIEKVFNPEQKKQIIQK